MTPNPLIWNPFAVLGLPDWPDLDDETVRAAWAAIAAGTHPGRPDGGDLARYTQACAAFTALNSPWARSEAYADLIDQAWPGGRDDDPGVCYLFSVGQEEPPWPVPGTAELGPVPWAEVVRLAAELPARIRRGHPQRTLARAAATAALCATLLAVFPGSTLAGFAVAVLIVVFVVSAREDMAPLSRPVRRNPPAGKK
jgi:hypothetical protein